MKFLGLIALVPLLVVANPSHILGAVRSIFDPPAYKQQAGYRPIPSPIRIPAPGPSRQTVSYRPIQARPVVNFYRPIPAYSQARPVVNSYRPIPAYGQSNPVVSSYRPIPAYGPSGSYVPIPADRLDLINNIIGGFWPGKPVTPKPEKVKEDKGGHHFGYDAHDGRGKCKKSIKKCPEFDKLDKITKIIQKTEQCQISRLKKCRGFHFGYNDKNGPETWPEHFPTCGGNAQSPIDISLNDLEPKVFPKLVQSNYWTQPEKMVVENNGHSIQVSGTFPYGKTPSISGGPLKNDYEFKQMHIHWGMDDDSGSEHTVNGNKFPMELHVVHWNKKYGTYENAASKSDGLAVAGYFFDISDEANPMLEKFMRYTSKVEGKDAKEVKVSDPLPIGILNLECTDGYVNYQGSLTTPPCSEVVTWIVCVKPLTLSAEQMQELRTVVKDDNHEDIHNYRPVQPLNGRKVYLSV